MADTVDELQIKINAEATKANDAIDRLVGKLDRLTTSLSRVNGTNLNGLANGVQRLGNAMQVMNTIKTADFTRLATNLTRLGAVNVSALNSAAGSMSHLTRAFDSLGTVSANAQAVGEMAKNIAKLGNKSVQTAIANIPQLAAAMNNLMTTLSRAPMVSQNVIQMTNALVNLASQGSKVGSASNSIVRGLNKTSASTRTSKKSFGGLASSIGRFYATYFMVIRGLKGLWSSIESTADYIEAYNYFNVALGKIGSDWSHQYEQYGYENAESYAKSFSTRLSESLGKLSGLKMEIGADGQGILSESGMKNLGLNIQEITQYASQLASVTNSVGQTGEVSLAIAKNFTRLAGDISSLFNIDYSSVAKNLQSGLIGQSRALYKYGIDITNATLQTYAYNLGLSKSVSEMTQAEKMQLRMLAILDQSKVSWGDLANTINSPSNMIRQFKNNLKEAGMVLGQLFIPILQRVLPVINGVTIAIKRLLVNIASFFGIDLDIDSFGKGYSDLGDDVDDVSDSFDDATGSAKKLKAQLQGFDEINNISSNNDAGSGISGDSIDLTEEILKASNNYESVWNKAFENMQNKALDIADNIGGVFDELFKPLSDFAESVDWGKFATTLEKIWNVVGKPMKNVGKGVLTFFSSLAKFVGYSINVMLDLVSVALDGLYFVVDKIPPEIFEALGAAIAGMLTAFAVSKISTIATKIAGFSKVLGGFGKVISGFKAFVVSNPYVAVFSAVVGAAVYGIKELNEYYNEKSINKLKDFMDTLNTDISLSGALENFSSDVDKITQKYDILIEKFSDTSVLKDNLHDSWIALDSIVKYVELVPESLGDKLDEIVTAFISFSNDLALVLTTIHDNIITGLSGAIGTVYEGLGYDLGGVVEDIDFIQEQGLNAYQEYVDKVNALMEKQKAGEITYSEFITEVSKLRNELGKISGEADDFTKALDLIGQIDFSELVDGNAEEIFEKYKESIQSAYNSIDEFWKKALEDYDYYSTVASNLGLKVENFDVFLENKDAIYEGLKKEVDPIIQGQMTKLLEDALAALPQSFEEGTYNEYADKILRPLFKEITDTFSEYNVEVPDDIVLNFLNSIKEGFSLDNVADKLNYFSELQITMTRFQEVFDALYPLMTEEGGEIARTLLTEFWDTINSMGVSEDYGPDYGKVFSYVPGLLDELVSTYQYELEKRKSSFEMAGETAGNSISDGIFKRIEENMPKVINSIRDKYMKNIEVGAIAFGSIGLNATIPKLANGAVIPANSPYLAVVGDQTSGTNIETPLSTMVDAFNTALAQNGGGGDIHIEIDGREIFNVTRKYANNYTKATGQYAFG